MTKSPAIDYSGRASITGTLVVDFSPHKLLGLPGAQKTAHPAWVTLPNGVKLANFNIDGMLAAKQPYYKKTPTGPMKRYEPKKEASILSTELICIEWADTLLEHTYDWAAKEEELKKLGPRFEIPDMRFVDFALARASTDRDKFVLLETAIDPASEGHKVIPTPRLLCFCRALVLGGMGRYVTRAYLRLGSKGGGIEKLGQETFARIPDMPIVDFRNPNRTISLPDYFCRRKNSPNGSADYDIANSVCVISPFFLMVAQFHFI